MTVLVTGGTGFIGLTIAEALAREGETVVAFDLNPPPEGSVSNTPILFVQGDARDDEHLSSIMREHRVSAAVLTAAITADQKRETRAARTVIDVNVGGVAAGLQACAAADVSRVLLLSSGAVYGARGRTDATLEEDAEPLRPENLYGLTKLASEMIAMRLSEVLDIDLSVGRLGTCFGPLERETGLRDTLSPHWQVMRLAQAGQPALLPRAGRRDWLYSRDAAAAAIAVLRSRHRRHFIYNLAAGFVWSVSEWCAALQSEFPGFEWRFAEDVGVANVTYYSDYDRSPLAIGRLIEDTDFRPYFDMEKSFEDLFHANRNVRVPMLTTRSGAKSN